LPSYTHTIESYHIEIELDIASQAMSALNHY